MSSLFILNKSSLASIGLSLLLCTTALSIVFPISGISVIIASISLLVGLYVSDLKRNNALIIGCLFVFITAHFLIAYLFFDTDEKILSFYFFSFTLYGLCGLIYSGAEIDYTTFYRVTLVWAAIVSIIIYKITFNGYLPSSVSTPDDAAKYFMSVSQAVGLILLVLFFNVFEEKSTIFRVISLLLFIFYFVFMFSYGARSFLLAFFIFIAFYILKKKGALSIPTVFFLILGLLLLATYFNDFVLWLNTLLSEYNLESRTITRLVRYQQLDGDASAGRYTIWLQGFHGFLSSPIIGNGIASFETKYGYYVHNLIIQLLYEGGVILATPIIYVLFKFSKLLFSRSIRFDDWVFIFLIFCSGVIYLFFSTVVWRSLYFWFFIGWVICYKKPKNKIQISCAKTEN